MTNFLTTQNLDLPSVKHGFFTREDGASEGLYASLNTGYGSGDDLEKVSKNRKRVANALGSKHDEILTCYQIHSNICHIVEDMSDTQLEGDALVTNTPGLAIAILTADCVPVLFADPETRIIGAAHAGWKGAKDGILENTIDTMCKLGATKEHIHAAIGPAISQDSYEVTTEFKQQFTELDRSFSTFFKPGKDEAHAQFDLTGLVFQEIRRLGVANSEKLDYDTYADEERFFSYRRATHRAESVYGRQCSAIMIG